MFHSYYRQQSLLLLTDYQGYYYLSLFRIQEINPQTLRGNPYLLLWSQYGIEFIILIEKTRGKESADKGV